jgi:general secretion pathway protein N
MARRLTPLHNAPQATTPWRWAVVGALMGLVVALVVFAPARWLAAALAQASGGQVVLASPRGTVWQGSAQLVFSGGAGSVGQVALPGRIQWRLMPSVMGGGEGQRGLLLANVLAPCCMATPLTVQAQPRWGGALVRVADHLSNWPAGLLAGLGTPWNTIQAQGVLALSTQGLAIEFAQGRTTMAGRVQVDAQDMASRLSTLKPMGSYRLAMTGGALNGLQLETLQGSLQLSGSGQWVGGRLRFNGEASATADRLDALSNLLNIIGRRDGARAIIKVG